MANTAIDPEKAHDYYLTTVTMISVSAHGKNNVMAATRTLSLSAKPPLIGISMGTSRFSYDAIQTSGEFVVNIAATDQVDLALKVGKTSGRDLDKFAEFAIPIRSATKVNAPLIDGCAANMECKLVNTVEVGDHMLVVGEIVAMHVDEEKVPAARLRGKNREVGS